MAAAPPGGVIAALSRLIKHEVRRVGESVEERVDRSFWLLDGDGVRHFPVRIVNRATKQALFRVSDSGNTLADGREVSDIDEVADLVISHGFSVRAVPEDNLRQAPSLLKLNARKIVSYGRTDEDPMIDGYWAAFGAAWGEPNAGWTASPKNWVRVVTSGKAYVSCVYHTREGWIRVGLGLAGEQAPERYEALLSRRASLEKEFGDSLIWDTKEDRQKRQIFVKLGCDPTDQADWPRQHHWLAERVPFFARQLDRA